MIESLRITFGRNDPVLKGVERNTDNPSFDVPSSRFITRKTLALLLDILGILCHGERRPCKRKKPLKLLVLKYKCKR